MTIGSLAVNVLARTEKFSRSMKTARGDVKLFGKAVSSAKGMLVGFGAAMAAGFTVRGLKNTADDIDRISKSARSLGIATESLVGLEHAADLSGVSLGKLQQALQRANVLLSDARRGDTAAISAFGRLGLDIRELDGIGADKVLARIADRVAKFSDSSDKAGAAAEFFGKKMGPGLVDFLNQGSAGLAKMQADAEALGLTFNAIDGQKVEEANDALTRTMAAIKGLARELVITLGPAIKQAADGTTDLIGLYREGSRRAPQQLRSALGLGRNSVGVRWMNNLGFDARTEAEKFNEFMQEERANGVLAAAERRNQNKATSARTIAEAPVRGVSAAFGKLGRLAGDGADALGKLVDKGRKLEQASFLAATRQMFGFGPFDASRMQGTPLPPIAERFTRDDLSAFFRGSDASVRGNAALEKGTAAAFSQERRSAQQNQLVEEAKKQTKLLDEAVDALNELKGKDLGAQLLPANVV